VRQEVGQDDYPGWKGIGVCRRANGVTNRAKVNQMEVS
jgi:hypothetical protein